jgi:phosphotransferase system HPr (HPr) family protein
MRRTRGHGDSLQQRSTVVVNRLGLHARAAAQLVRRASQFTSSVEIVRPDTNQSADGKSILRVLVLAASQGTELIIKTAGEDEERAADALVELIRHGFGEELSNGVY